jgi:hypothetical protein
MDNAWVVVAPFLPLVLPRISVIHFPGGARVDMQQLERAEQAADQMDTGGEVREIDPALASALDANDEIALAGIRIEIERYLRKLMEFSSSKRKSNNYISMRTMMNILYEEKLLDDDERMLLLDIIPILNAAVHAETIQPDVRRTVIRVASTIIARLQSKLEELGQRNC